jgi:DNA polymerase-3 subunit beta
MIEGKYPNFRAVIPQDNNKKATIERLALISLLKRVLVFCNKNSNLIKFTLSDGKLQVNAVDLDLSMSADETMPVEYKDKHMSIGFNGEYLLDLLINMQSSDSVCFLLSDPTRAVIVTDAEPTEGEKLTYIIMPMAINY